jgi:CRP-like cAMP-binding protein
MKSKSPKEKFASQASPELLAAMRQLAKEEGKQFQALLDEAMREYLERKSINKPRQHVMEQLGLSIQEFNSLYQKLAK